MSQIGRSIKNVEVPRPLKSQSRTHIVKNNYMLIEDLMQLIDNVAASLAAGISKPEAMVELVQNLRIHGMQLETISKDTLDRAFVTFRNASQDERLNIMTRLNLLELIELRAKSWKDEGINMYYKHKATNVEPENTSILIVDQSSGSILGTSPQTLANSSAHIAAVTVPQPPQSATSAAAIAAATAAVAASQLLGPGELIRNSGKFTKPTKIPGKNYTKDEVVIRNADSGKVMGIKGRRVHMIEELSGTIISFQRVNLGAKERLVQITGPNEEKINYAKHLIEDTIRRNASPVRLEPTLPEGGGQGGGSCSSLASSNSDETTSRPSVAPVNVNRNSIGGIFGSAPGITGNEYIVGGTNPIALQNQIHGHKQLRPTPLNTNQPLLHSFSTNDASLGEYKYTVNVGHHLIKITGDNCELVRAAKLVLDDYFSSNDFLASVEAGSTTLDGSMTSTNSFTASSPAVALSPTAPRFAAQPYQLTSASQCADSGIGLNYMAGQISGSGTTEGDDDVFIIEENGTSTPVNGLSRSRRSHFSRKDSIPDGKSQSEAPKINENVRIVHEYERLIYYAKSPHSWALPRDWQKIYEKHPTLIRNKDNSDETQRFDADKYLQFVKSGTKRVITIDESTTADLETLENE